MTIHPTIHSFIESLPYITHSQARRPSIIHPSSLPTYYTIHAKRPLYAPRCRTSRTSRLAALVNGKIQRSPPPHSSPLPLSLFSGQFSPPTHPCEAALNPSPIGSIFPLSACTKKKKKKKRAQSSYLDVPDNTGPHASSRRSIDPWNMEEGRVVGRGEEERILVLRTTNLTLPPSQRPTGLADSA